MGNGSANRGRLPGVARVSVCWRCWRSSRRLRLSRSTRDRDRDGLSDRYERKKSHTERPSGRHRSRPASRTADAVRKSRTNPRRADTDRDGLSDGFELQRSRTNPRKRDTDRDGMADGTELLLGRNPRRARSPAARAGLQSAPLAPSRRRRTPTTAAAAAGPAPARTTITTGPVGTVRQRHRQPLVHLQRGRTPPSSAVWIPGAWADLHVAEGVLGARRWQPHLLRPRDRRAQGTPT